MANYDAVFSLGNSLAQHLQNNFPPELRTQFPNVKFQLVSSAQIAAEDQTHLDQVVSIFLHRISTNENFRSATRLLDDPGRQPMLFVDLHYQITFWGTDAQAEQTILAWTMLQLQSTPILDSSVLAPITVWDPTENVQLVPADLSLEDILRVWDALGPKYRLSISYIARAVRIDRVIAPAAPVLATRFTFEQEVPR